MLDLNIYFCFVFYLIPCFHGNQQTNLMDDMELESSYEDSVGHDNSGMTYDEEDNSHNTHETELSFEDDEIREIEHYENGEVEIDLEGTWHQALRMLLCTV